MALFSSSTQTIPVTGEIPQHIAVIMDGNGRWAKKRFLPRVAGHKRGVEVVREMVRLCANNGVKFLTLFAFSSENWRRPADEVTFLMSLFMEALQQEVGKLAENNIRLVMIGDKSRFEPALTAKIAEAEAATANNDGLTLTIAANYGGRWDVMQALQRLIQDKPRLCKGSAKKSWLLTSACTTRLNLISLSARVGSNASATSCSGNWPIVNCISQKPYGQILTRPNSSAPLLHTSNASVASAAPANNWQVTKYAENPPADGSCPDSTLFGSAIPFA